MKRYGLFTKNSDEAINNIPSQSLEEAKLYFTLKKQLTVNQFDQLFEVKLIK